MVLVLGNSGDWSLAEVGKELDIRGMRWELVNTGDFPIRMDMDTRLELTGADWLGELVAGEARVQVSEVTAVYYGKPTDFELPAGLSGPELRFSRAQARVGLGGVLASLPVRWVSHPSALADASFKPAQLSRLRRAGLTTPPTLITNKAVAVRAFAASHGDLVVKPLAEPVVWEGGGESVIYTRRMTPADLDCLDGIEVTAHLFQQWQDKKYEARVIAVGDHLFAVAIHAGSDQAYVDWRADYESLRYEVIDVPDYVRAGIFRYLDIAGLASSVFDFVIRPDGAQGKWIALEALLTQATTAGEGIGLPSSSSSRPRVMAVMLDRLAVRSGHRVLEIGTGTGYNTALLGHRLGADNVYSIDLDPHLVASARDHLADVGQYPHLAPGDGAKGWPEHAPFDRILATCAITHIPPAWIDQLAEGGQIVAPLDAGEAGPLLVLTKTASHEVTGRIDPYPAHFMPMRERADNPLGTGQSTQFTATGGPHYGTTTLDPTSLLAADRTNLALFLWLHAPGLRIAGGDSLGKVYVNTTTALAEATLTSNDDGTWPVTQRGLSRLWDTIEHGHAAWLALAHPDPARLGITARNTEDGHEDEQYVWLDDPEGTHSWALTAPSATK